MAPPPSGDTFAANAQLKTRVSGRLQVLSPDPNPATAPGQAQESNQTPVRLAPSQSVVNPFIISTPPSPSPSPAPAENTQRISEKPQPYPNHFDDPDPAPDSAPAAEKELKKLALQKYRSDMLEAYRATTMSRESLWLDFATAFLPPSSRSWTLPMLARWTDFLTSRDVFFITGRRISRSEAMVELLFREDHVNETKPGDRRLHTIPSDNQAESQIRTPQPNSPNPATVPKDSSSHSTIPATSPQPSPKLSDDSDPDVSSSGDPVHKNKFPDKNSQPNQDTDD